MWHFAQDGAAQGPISHSELCEIFAASQMPLETQVWTAGMPGWVAASTIDDFRGIWGKGFGPGLNPRQHSTSKVVRSGAGLAPVVGGVPPVIPLAPPAIRSG